MAKERQFIYSKHDDDQKWTASSAVYKPHKSYWNLWPSAKSEVELVMHRTFVSTRGRRRCVPSRACRGSYENKFIYPDGMSYVSERAYLLRNAKLISEIEKLNVRTKI